MKKVLYGLIGFLSGIILMTTIPVIGAVKEYILKESSNPVYVNGIRYNDSELPILDYNGRTYIPLSKIGDLLNVDYRWNSEKKQVEIGKSPDNNISNNNVNDNATKGTTNNASGLYTVEGKGKYTGYKMLKGYPDEDKYQIYFQGNANSYFTTIEDTRKINLSENITWNYNGKTFKTKRSDLYSYFSDITWFKSNLKNDNITDDWLMTTFGNTYLEWAESLDFSNEAARWVQKYFDQTSPNKSNATLDRNTVVVPVNEPAKELSIDEIIENINKNMENSSTDSTDKVYR